MEGKSLLLFCLGNTNENVMCPDCVRRFHRECVDILLRNDSLTACFCSRCRAAVAQAVVQQCEHSTPAPKLDSPASSQVSDSCMQLHRRDSAEAKRVAVASPIDYREDAVHVRVWKPDRRAPRA